MGNAVDLSEAELLRLVRATERDCQEGVKWERRKLEWILEEECKQAEAKQASEAALSQPVFTIVAGSTGCGKRSLTTLARNHFQRVPVLDPDAIARSLQQMSAGIISGIEAGLPE